MLPYQSRLIESIAVTQHWILLMIHSEYMQNPTFLLDESWICQIQVPNVLCSLWCWSNRSSGRELTVYPWSTCWPREQFGSRVSLFCALTRAAVTKYYRLGDFKRSENLFLFDKLWLWIFYSYSHGFEVQDQGVGRFGFSTGLSPWHSSHVSSHGLSCVCISGVLPSSSENTVLLD